MRREKGLRAWKYGLFGWIISDTIMIWVVWLWALVSFIDNILFVKCDIGFFHLILMLNFKYFLIYMNVVLSCIAWIFNNEMILYGCEIFFLLAFRNWQPRIEILEREIIMRRWCRNIGKKEKEKKVLNIVKIWYNYKYMWFVNEISLLWSFIKCSFLNIYYEITKIKSIKNVDM